MADADAMWNLGRDAKSVSLNDAVGKAYKAVEIPTLYYWCTATTPNTTREFIEANALNNRTYNIESHWPTVRDPEATAHAIHEFFGDAT